nr:ATP-binding protein [Aquisalimonas asiatica]
MQRDIILQSLGSGTRGQVIFVAGIHGVGKTSLCAAIAGQEGMQHHSAGRIIRDEDAAALSGETKAVSNINHTQRLLVNGVNRIRQGERALLLDGHCALVNGSGQVEAIGQEVFDALDLAGIILVYDSPKRIYERLVARDSTSFTVATLTKLQSVEIAAADAIAQGLGIPIIRVRAADRASIEKVRARIWRELELKSSPV